MRGGAHVAGALVLAQIIYVCEGVRAPVSSAQLLGNKKKYIEMCVQLGI
jgi:hypothetical protein